MSADERVGGTRYEPVAELARGGMASLQLARVRGPSGFTKYVVLKRILAKWADDDEFVGMFLDEARLAATLEHPNVVHVYDAGRDAEGPFFAMEYIHGEDLAHLGRRLRERGELLPLGHALQIASGIAAGLHHAHERRDYDGRPLGIIHRDVSPNNVLVTYEGGVKVVDFGIAKASISQHATRPSVRKGKIAFMSPEQCKGDPLDRRSDVFSLGAVLYELLTGQRLFSAENEFATMNRIVNHDAPAASRRRSEIPPELDRIVGRALAREPSRRYESARALQRELEALAREQGLVHSTGALGDYLEGRLGARPYPWTKIEAEASSTVVDAKPGLATDDGEDATLVNSRPPVLSSVDGPEAPTRRNARGATDDPEATKVTSRPLVVAREGGREPGPRRWIWMAVPLLLGAVGLAWAVGARPVEASRSEDAGSAPTPRAKPRSEALAPPPSSEASAPRASVDALAGTSTGASSTGSELATDSDSHRENDEPSPVAPRRRTVRRSRPRSEPTTPPPRVPFDPDGPAPRRDPP